MTSNHSGRQDGRPKAPPLKPHERAGLFRAALKYRAEFRARTAGAGKEPEPRLETDEEPDRRARYAVAIARAEFGRFYWKEEGRRRKPRQRKRPHPEGARPA